MTPTEILKEVKADYLINCQYSKTGIVDPDSYFTSLTIKLLEGEIERLKGMKKEYLKHIDPKGITNEDVDSYNQAIDDQITYLESQLSEIKKI